MLNSLSRLKFSSVNMRNDYVLLNFLYVYLRNGYAVSSFGRQAKKCRSWLAVSDYWCAIAIELWQLLMSLQPGD